MFENSIFLYAYNKVTFLTQAAENGTFVYSLAYNHADYEQSFNYTFSEEKTPILTNKVNATYEANSAYYYFFSGINLDIGGNVTISAPTVPTLKLTQTGLSVDHLVQGLGQEMSCVSHVSFQLTNDTVSCYRTESLIIGTYDVIINFIRTHHIT